jgi:hypothetical protein
MVFPTSGIKNIVRNSGKQVNGTKIPTLKAAQRGNQPVSTETAKP